MNICVALLLRVTQGRDLELMATLASNGTSGVKPVRNIAYGVVKHGTEDTIQQRDQVFTLATQPHINTKEEEEEPEYETIGY